MEKPLGDWKVSELIDSFFNTRNIENELNLEWHFSDDKSTVIAFDRKGNPAVYPCRALLAHIASWFYACELWSDGFSDSDQPPLA